MKWSVKGLGAAALACAMWAGGVAPGESAPPVVGGAAMYPSRTFVENAMNSHDHTTLVAAVQAAGLVDKLEGRGPFTVFAPTDAAFAKLPAGTLDSLMRPENKKQLVALVNYGVVAGKLDGKKLRKQIKRGGGKATLTTLEGGTLTASVVSGALTLTDAKGDVATVTTGDVRDWNGVMYVTDTVLMP